MSLLTALLPLLFLVLAGLLAVPFVASLRSGRLDPFEPILFYALFVGMMGVVLFDRAYLSPEPWRFDAIPYTVDAGVAIVLLAYVAVLASTLAGYYLAPRVLDVSLLAGLVPTTSAHGRFLRRAGLAYVVVGTGALLALVVTVLRGDPLFLYRSSRPRSEVLGGATVLNVLTNALVVGYLVYLSGVVIDERDLPVRLLALAPLVPAAYVVTGSRGRIGISVLSVLLFCYYLVRHRTIGDDALVARLARETPRPVVAGGAVAAGAIGAVGIVVAEALRMGQSLREAATTIDPIAILSAGVPASSPGSFLALREIVPADRGYFYGTFYLRVLTNFVPSAIWEDKPVTTHGSMLRRVLRPEGAGGHPARELGAYYVNFGVVGFVLLGGLFGVLLRVAYEFLRRNRGSPLAIVLYGLFLTTVARNGLTNNALSTFLQFFAILSPVLVGYYAVAIRSRELSVHSDPS